MLSGYIRPFAATNGFCRGRVRDPVLASMEIIIEIGSLGDILNVWSSVVTGTSTGMMTRNEPIQAAQWCVVGQSHKL